MDWISTVLDNFKAQDTKTYSSSNNDDMVNLFGLNTGSINSSNAQKIATVFACVDIKAKALAVIPIKLYKRTNSGKEEDRTNPLYELLRYAPNPDITASIYKKMISQDIDLRGNHFTQIQRNGLGQVVGLYPLVADKMVVTVLNGKKTYKYDNKTVSPSRILHLFDIPNEDGTYGLSKIEYARVTLEYANNTAEHGNILFKNSAMPSGAFEKEGSLTDQAHERLKKGLKEQYVGLKNNGTPMLLEEGLKFNPLRMTNSDSEWLESRKFNREEVGAIFGVPVAMLNDANNTAYGNLEQKYLEFYSGTIFPLTTITEEKFRQDLLTKKEKVNNVIKFKYNTMLRVDAKTRAEYYKTRFGTGSISPNEIRAYEDENGFDNGDDHYIELNRESIENPRESNSNIGGNND